MPRTYARIKTETWRNSDWLKLTGNAQRLYWVLLSHPKLTLCGTLDLAVGKWSRLAADTTRDDIETALKELDLAGFVVVDVDAEELAIRTFLRHDLSPGRMNQNLAIGFWRAWEGIESETLRDLIVRQIEPEMWDKTLGEPAPDDAWDTWHMAQDEAKKRAESEKP